MRICVTGASGLVGSRLCDYLTAFGHEVIKVSRNRQDYVVTGDMGADTNWSEAIAGCDVVVHLSARVHVMRDGSANPLAEFRKSNVEATRSLALQAAASGVKRFVFISTVKVNGEFTPLSQPFTFANEPDPQDNYAISKHEAEQALWQLARGTGMEVVVIRPPLVYGPGVKGNFARMVLWVRRGVPLPLGSVQNLRSLVALDSLVDLIAVCADTERSPMAANQTLLVSDGEDVSTTELLRRVALAYEVSPRLLPIPAHWLHAAARFIGKGAMADRLLGSLQVDVSKTCELLGWKPPVTMDEQLRKMALYDAMLPMA
jgi:nucleoside-diphosphate-sugar epimerase